jgi:hypothetical protein
MGNLPFENINRTIAARKLVKAARDLRAPVLGSSMKVVSEASRGKFD